jgi:8-amino-7-oxononanoate synthase
MSNSLDLQLKQILDERKLQHSFRQLIINDELIDFCSNDYLGLGRFDQPKGTELDFLRKNGATGSRLLRGNSKMAEELENSLALWYNAEAALVFNSGYSANLGFFSTLPKRGDTILYDQYCHASIRDGIRLSHARNSSFKHNDYPDLKHKLINATGNVFVVVESVYSMDGDEPPLQEIATLCKENGVFLIVDEAHSFGLFGEKGAGLCRELGIEEACFARIITFGKAAGAHGAAILGSSVLKDYLINFCRSFIYTTALPPQAYQVIFNACQQLQSANESREKVNSLIKNMAEWKAMHPGISLISSRSAIQCLLVPGNEQVRLLAQHLQSDGIDARAILSPTVAIGAERLRICLHSFNSIAELSRLQAGIVKFFSED